MIRTGLHSVQTEAQWSAGVGVEVGGGVTRGRAGDTVSDRKQTGRVLSLNNDWSVCQEFD